MTRTLFCHDTYYYQDNKNTYSYGAFPYALWAERYLPHCDHIHIIGRKKDTKDGNPELSSGENASFTLLPNINTPLKRIFTAKRIYTKIKAHVQKADLIIIRGPVEFGMLAAKAARALGKPYVVEMSGCAFDHTWYHGSIIGKLYAPAKYLRARHMVKHANAALYVTQNFLQNRYPNKHLTEYASNVEIPKHDDTALQKRLTKPASDTITFGLIGNHTNHLKGLPVALKALARIKGQMPNFKLRILGHGDPKKWQKLIHTYELQNHIIFDAPLPGGAEILNWLDNIDIYLQPSYHEGLPRALIEAMSRACPALASNAGGTDELLEASLIHKKGDDITLSSHILALLNDDQKQHAKQNFKTAKNYTKDKLKPRREQFYRKIYNEIRSLKA